MLTDGQGRKISKELNLSYLPAIYSGEVHEFGERRMVNCMWVHHTFNLPDRQPDAQENWLECWQREKLERIEQEKI